MRTAIALLMAVSAFAASPVAVPRISRSAMVTVERNFDQRVERAIPTDQFLLLGATRGIYLDGYGAVFTAEVNLMSSANANPFRPSFTKDEIEQIRRKKIDRLPVLRKQIREALIGAAATLDQVPEDQQVVIGVVVHYFKWEDIAGLPGQVVMQAPKKALVAAAKGQAAGLDSVLLIQEY